MHMVLFLMAALISTVVVAVEPESVSMIQVLSNPEKYDGKKLQLMGYLHLEFEGNGLYLHKEDEQRGLSKNGLWVDTRSHSYKDMAALNDTYVLVEGTFTSRRQGHMDLWSGEIHSIDRVIAWPPR